MISMRFLVFLLVATVILPSVHGSEGVSISGWQVSLSPESDQGASVEVFMKVSTDAYAVTNIVFSFNGDSVEYLPPKTLGGKKEELGDVRVSSSGGMTTVTVDLATPVVLGEEREISMDLMASGIFEMSGDSSSVDFKLETPRAVLDTGEEVDIGSSPGTIRLHAPVGYLPATSQPDPWREVWQGVSGFESHFLLIYDTVPLNQGVKATFTKSGVVEKASEVDSAIDDAEDMATDEQVSRAKTHLGRAIDLLISGTSDEADEELEKALEALSGTTPSTPSPSPDTSAPKGICGPAFLLVLAPLAAFVRRRAL